MIPGAAAALILATAASLLAQPTHRSQVVEVRVREGGRALLPCKSSDSTRPDWRKDGRAAADQPRYTVDPVTSSLVIARVRPTDRGVWLCHPRAHPVQLIVLEIPGAPYLMIDGRRLDAGNQFVPVKENSELSVECVVEGGSPEPGLHWVLLPAAPETSPPSLNLRPQSRPSQRRQTTSVASLPTVIRAHHNATVACIVTHPTLPAPLNASLLLDVQFMPSFAISRVPGFGFPLREGIPVSLKCDVDSNPPSNPVWEKDDRAPPVEQSGDGYLNFTSIRREHSGWYKCTARHLLTQYSSIGYYLNVRSGEEVGESTEAGMEVSVGGAVQLECGGSGSGGCWGRVAPSGSVSPLGPGAPLSIHSVLYQQAGHYRCYAPHSDQLNLWRTHNVHLKVTGMPMVVASNLSRKAEAGDSVELEAEFCANPRHTKVLWLLPSLSALPPGVTRGSITTSNITEGNWTDCYRASLKVNQLGLEHSGDFSLLVWSGRGIGQISIMVNVTGASFTAGMATALAPLLSLTFFLPILTLIPSL